jgi:ribonuclease P protein component
MLPKQNRADKDTVTQIFAKGRFITAPHLTFKYISNKNLETTQISFITPKTVSKKAVDRNLLRRRGYAVLKKNITPTFSGKQGVFIFGKKSLEHFGAKNKLAIQNLENEIKNILYKLN